MIGKNKNIILANGYDEFRDLLSTSGIFEYTDCLVEIWCPLESETEEIDRMVRLLESMVHVTDVKIGSDIQNLTSDNYRVVITEDSEKIGKRFIGEK